MRSGGSRRLGHLIGSLAAALPIVAAAPPLAAGAEPTALPGGTIVAGVTDLDGDGAREVVRLVTPSSESAAISVEAWRYGSGGWAVAGVAEMLPEPNAATLDAATLLLTTIEGRDRVLAVTAEGIQGDQFGMTCCLSLAEVHETGGEIALAPVAVNGIDRNASVIQAVDFDGDETDELVTMRMTWDVETSTPESAHLELLSRRAGRYVEVGEVDIGGRGGPMVRGETDGRPGAELVFSEPGSIQRVTMVEGKLLLESADIAESGGDPFDGWVAGIAGERVVLVDRLGVRTLRWPSGGVPEVVDELRGTGQYPSINVVGEGPDAIVISLADAASGGVGPPRGTIRDLALRRMGDLPSSVDQAAWRFIERRLTSEYSGTYPAPYFGPLPSELGGGRPAFAGNGWLIAPDGEGGYQTRSMSPLAGLIPWGTAGPEDRWLALSSSSWFWPSTDVVYVQPITPDPSLLGRLVLLPVAQLWEQSDAMRASISLDGAAFNETSGRLLSGPDGFTLELDAPTGTVVLAGERSIDSYEVGSEPLAVAYRPRNSNEEGNSDFEYGLIAVMPDGRVLGEDWEGTVLREQPKLDAASFTTAFQLGASVRGSVVPYAGLVVDGQPAEVLPDGSFDVEVDAPPWPRDVVVVARDALGNETSIRVQVIGFLDYRGWPWIPIAGLATVLVGVYAYLRIPRTHTGHTPERTDDATLEEIELE